MKRSFRSQKSPAALPDTLVRHLSSYALAATAAGVSALACSPRAEARVVHHRIGAVVAGNGYYLFNPAGNNVAFGFYGSFLDHGPTSYWNRVFLKAKSTGAFFLSGPGQLPAALRASSKIGPARHFEKGPSYGGLLFTYGNYGGGTKNHHRGNFDFNKIEFVGLKFAVSGKEHYGWLRLKIRINGVATFTDLIDYGYETIPGKAIKAGQEKELRDGSAAAANTRGRATVSPGLLALGSSGMSVWRPVEAQ